MMLRERSFRRSDLLVLVIVVWVLIGMGSLLGGGMLIHDDFHRNLRCQDNLRRYGSAFAMYLDDHDQIFPDSYYWFYNEEGDRITRDTGSYYCRFHIKALNPVNHPEWAGSLWRYMPEPNVHICPTFDHLARSGLGAMHYGHNSSIPVECQYTYSMNGYLGGGRFGVVKKLGQIERSAAGIFSFSEENAMWNIRGRSAVSAVLNSNIITRLRPGDGGTFSGAFATYHMAPSEEIELQMIDGGCFALQSGKEYPKWGLCRGWGNAVFLDLHVQSMPYHVDTHDYAWPLKLGNR